MNIVIRTDASIEIGTGHVMRCLTLAKQLKRHGAEVTFFCRSLNGNTLSYLEGQGMLTKLLPAIDGNQADIQWTKENGALDAEQTIAFIKNYDRKVDLLIVDHYGLDYRWEQQLRPFTNHLMVIDDLADRRHDCDLLLDQNYYLNMKERYQGLIPNNCVQMLGPDYVLLRDEFLQVAHKQRERTGEVKNVLVFFGGSDPTGETLKTIKALRELKRSDIEIHVVVGASNPLRNDIKKQCSEIPNVYFYCQVNNMAELMGQADLAIGAGGATTWERCFLGLPAMTVVIADNQLEATMLLHEEEVIVYIGESEQVTSETIKNNLLNLIDNQEQVRCLSENSRMIVNSEKVKENIVLRTIRRTVGGLA